MRDRVPPSTPSGEPERVTESAPTPSCPQEVTLTDLLAGLLSEEHRVSVLAHVESCADCRWGPGGGEWNGAPTDALPIPEAG
ncbi:zf-HC2 domain-containing protein [Myxococcus sp. AM011]|uniref:zf-HC2 domain-containing protein n=2 Tax=Myxococcus TaxID=32 RepID=UPI0020CBD8A7|nr:zf-HC2 domain-containing protein [Myxococcus sp. AM011]